MARPIGDKGAHKTIALSRPQGGWFAKIWNERNRGGSSGGGDAPALAADKITLGRCAPFTLWVGEGINTVPPAASEPAPATDEPAAITALPSKFLAEEHFDKQKDEEAPHHESDPEPAVVAAADLGSPSRPPSRAFSIWTTKEALAAPAPAAVPADEDDEDEALVVFDECEGAVAAEVLAKLDPLPAPTAPKSRAFTVWASAEALATPRILKVASLVPAAAPMAFASRAFSVWTSAEALAAPKILVSRLTDEGAGEVEQAAGSGEIAPIPPIPVTESKAFTVWAGENAVAASSPVAVDPIPDVAGDATAAALFAIPGGAKAFTVWSLVAKEAQPPASSADDAHGGGGDPVPDGVAALAAWESESGRFPKTGVFPLVLLAIALLLLLITFFVIAAQNKKVRDLERRVGVLTGEHQEVRIENTQLAIDLQKAKAERAVVSGKLDATRAVGEALTEERDGLKRAIAEARAEHEKQVGAFEKKIADLGTALDGAKSKLTAATAERDKLAKAKAEGEKRIANLNGELEKVTAAKSVLEGSVTSIKKERDSLSQGLSKTQAALTKAEKETQALSAKWQDADARVDELNKKVAQLEGQIAKLVPPAAPSPAPEPPADPAPVAPDAPEPDSSDSAPAEDAMPEAAPEPKKDDGPTRV